MKIPYLSTTLINGWPICQLRTTTEHMTRVEHGDDFHGSEPTRFGSVVHDVVEKLHEEEMSNPGHIDSIDIEAFFDEVWTEHHAYDLDYYRLGRTKIKDFVLRTLHDRIGHTASVELPFLMDLKRDHHILLLHDMDRGEVLKECAKIRKKGGVPVISKIDRVDISDEFKRIQIFDYKTNAQPFSRSEVENSRQLALYTEAARRLYGNSEKYKEYEIESVFDMLRWGRFPHTFEEDDLQLIIDNIIALWYQIQNTKEPVPTRNTYCTWCPVRSECPEYAAAVQGEVPDVIEIEDGLEQEKLAEIFDQYNDLKSIEKIVKDRRSTLEGYLAKGIEELGDPEDLTLDLDNGKQIYLSPNSRSEYPVDKVWDIMRRKKALQVLLPALSVSKGAMDRLIKGKKLQGAEEDIKETLNTKYVKSSLKARNVQATIEEE